MRIPDFAELVDRGRALHDDEPSEGSVETVRNFFAKVNYRREVCPKLYDTLVRWGAKEIEKRNTRGLFIRGGCGVGKTYGVSVLANLLSFPVVNAKELEEKYMTMSDGEFDNYVDARNGWWECQVLAVDDLGVESSPAVKFGTPCNVLEVALDRRYRVAFLQESKHTIVTSNLSDEALERKYGLRILDRMDEMFEFCTVQGESMRRCRA